MNEIAPKINLVEVVSREKTSYKNIFILNIVLIHDSLHKWGPIPGSGLPEKYNLGGGGPKVELSPKPKIIPILGQSGALKIHNKTYPKQYTVFPFPGTDIFKRIIAISLVIHSITHFTFMLLIYVDLILQIYFIINATVALFTDVFKAVILVKSTNCPRNCHD